MTTTMHIKTDKKIKDRAEEFAKANGITLTALVNLSLRQVLRQGELTVTEPLVPNKKTAELLRQAMKDAKEGKNMSPAFDNAKDMDEYLSSLRSDV